MDKINEKRILSALVYEGLSLVKSNPKLNESILTSDRLLIEVLCNNMKYTDHELCTVYYKHEDHIHNCIEILFTINREV